MKIALCSTDVPFVNGGARNVVEWLAKILKHSGHAVEIVYIPQDDAPEKLFNQIAAFRYIDFSAFDRIICSKPESQMVQHPDKILWFIHHQRIFYDLWDSPHRPFPDNAKYTAFREALIACDNAAFREANRIYTNSHVVSARLQKYNNIDSEVLYPPVIEPERFYCQGYNDEIICISRINSIKRQYLLIEAMRHTKSCVRLRICGKSAHPAEARKISELIYNYKLQNKVLFEDRWISEKEKQDILGSCLAAAYIPLNEDSWGYFGLEAAHSRKALLTCFDSGGTLEFVLDEKNGLIVPPIPEALADAMDRLYWNRAETIRMGEKAQARIDELDISWKRVLEKLTA